MHQKLFLFFIVMNISSTAIGQNIAESDLIGSWKVKNVTANTSDLSLSEEQMKYVDEIRTAYGKAIFQFKENKEFKIEIPFEDISNQMQSACWRFDIKKSQIAVIDCSEKDIDEVSWEWPLNVSYSDDTYFFIAEPIFNLEMERIDQ